MYTVTASLTSVLTKRVMRILKTAVHRRQLSVFNIPDDPHIRMLVRARDEEVALRLFDRAVRDLVLRVDLDSAHVIVFEEPERPWLL